MSIPLPRDPRTPLQARRDQLAAAKRLLTTTHLPKDERQVLADRINALHADIGRLTADAA